MSEGKAAQPIKKRKIPVRRCIGCGEHKEKHSLLRVVKPPEDTPNTNLSETPAPDGKNRPQSTISLDPTGKKNGRGAYLCPDLECLKKARKRNALSHAFKCRVPDEIYIQLEEQLAAITAQIPAEPREEKLNAN
ncbi:MAG: YlxR family protein [Oscillospiraceae bacterium]|jgi:predicted RNA-binding protein YlxR (DUF448 family)|nr:YlxR family protein [Oscillospiraceae bacterium]